MTPDIFAEWFRRQGYRVVKTPSSHWVEVSPRIYQAIPYHARLELTPPELHQLLWVNKAVGVRYSAPWTSSLGTASYHVVFEQAEYELSDLPKKARHDVRRGLQAARIEPIPFSRLAHEGWDLRLDTLKRQRRERAETQAWWQRLCQSAEGLPGFEAWAAVVEGELAATLLTFTCGDYCSILYQQSRTKYLHLGVNNALAFVFTQEVLQRPGPPRLFYGLHSLDAPASVDEFKFRMGYTAKPVRQRVVFHPAVAPLFNSASHALLKGLLRLWPGSPVLAKAEGMVRFHLQGQRPLAEQPLPPPLAKCPTPLAQG